MLAFLLFYLIACATDADYQRQKNAEKINEIISVLTDIKLKAEISQHKKVQYDLDSLRNNLIIKFSSRKINPQDFVKTQTNLERELNIKILMSL